MTNISSGAQITQTNAPKKGKGGGNIEIDGYIELSKMKDPELKLMKMLSLYENLPSDPNQLTDASRRVYYEYLHPAYKCFTLHCGSSADAFFKDWNLKMLRPRPSLR